MVFFPAPIDEVVAAILEQRPEVVFAPHVETASGILLPDDYLSAVAAAVRQVGGLFVLDLVLTLLTAGGWLLIVLFRELWRRN